MLPARVFVCRVSYALLSEYSFLSPQTSVVIAESPISILKKSEPTVLFSTPIIFWIMSSPIIPPITVLIAPKTVSKIQTVNTFFIFYYLFVLPTRLAFRLSPRF